MRMHRARKIQGTGPANGCRCWPVATDTGGGRAQHLDIRTVPIHVERSVRYAKDIGLGHRAAEPDSAAARRRLATAERQTLRYRLQQPASSNTSVNRSLHNLRGPARANPGRRSTRRGHGPRKAAGIGYRIHLEVDTLTAPPAEAW